MSASRLFFLIILVLFFHISSLAQARVVEVTSYAYKVTAGKHYIVSVVPDSGTDAAFGVGTEPNRPMTVINNQAGGFSETYKLQAISGDLQVSVFVNMEGAGHTIAVIDEDQKFPFLKWTKKGFATLQTDAQNYITSFGFRWTDPPTIVSKGNSDLTSVQTVAAKSGISYTFEVTPDLPLDVLLVPATNHLDLELFLSAGDKFESSDNNRSAEDLTETLAGQVEWTQITPSRNILNIVVAEKSGFGGDFRIVVRPLNGTGRSLRPFAMQTVSANDLSSLLKSFYSDLPVIDERNAVTYEFEPQRTVSNYRFQAISLKPDLNFALVVRADKAFPPLFVPAGGTVGSSASITWTFREGNLSINGDPVIPSGDFPGFPTFGKIQISVVAFGGSGRIEASLSEASTLRDLELPRATPVERAGVVSTLFAEYEGYASIDNNLKIYRYTAEAGKTYKVKVSPQTFFDIALIDSSKRTFENPGLLEMIDNQGTGSPEELEIVANRGFIEIGVVSLRYSNGIVKPENRRIGGMGYFKIEISGNEETATDELEMILVSQVEVKLPNDSVLNELKLKFEPWTAYVEKTASDIPPFPSKFDNRITAALANELAPEN